MEKTYIKPVCVIVSVQSCCPLALSGPGAGDQTNPGINGSRRSRCHRIQWDDEEEEWEDEY